MLMCPYESDFKNMIDEPGQVPSEIHEDNALLVLYNFTSLQQPPASHRHICILAEFYRYLLPGHSPEQRTVNFDIEVSKGLP